MAKDLLGVAIAAVLGGVVGSGVTIVVTRSLTPTPEPRASPETHANDSNEGPADQPTEAGPATNTQRRVAQLERKVRVLTAALAQRNAPADDGGPGSTRNLDVADPVFEVAVMDIIDRVEEQKEEDRDERRAEMRRQFTDRMSDQLETALGLTVDQKRKLGEVIAQHFDAIRALRESENRPVTRAEWRERIDGITGESERKLGEFLSPDQMATYRELDEGERIGGGWGRGRRGR
jgi:hypothetical protein